MPDGTLPTLIRASRNVIAVRRLRCPDCGGDIELRDGRYHCLGVPFDQHEPTSPASFENLADLAVGEVLEGRG